jgi:predicted amidohydrolase YtcJ
MFTGTLQNSYDSHVHWLATGQQALRLPLQGLRAPEEIRRLKVEPHNFQGEWLIGFGWDQNLWPGQEFPNRALLDELFPDKPVAFSRVDGHATWTNSEGLKRAGLLNGEKLPEIPGGKIVTDEKGLPTGVLIDAAERLVDRLIPMPTAAEIRAFLIRGMRVFNQAGFTHIRDMTCVKEQWIEAMHLDETGILTLAVEVFFGAYDPKDFNQALAWALAAKHACTKNLRVKGVKVFCDGALGSEGALLSQCYCTGSGRGLSLLTDEQIEEFIRTCWDKDLEIAIHVIGDEAAHRVALVAQKLWSSGLKGRLNLEHVELLRPETIEALRGRDVVCHMQPCHFHTDRRWLREKLGGLYRFAFPWRALQEAEIPFFFGSDSPIEPPSLLDNLRAIEVSGGEEIPRLLGQAIRFQEHPDKAWAPNSVAHFEGGRLANLVFRGENVI